MENDAFANERDADNMAAMIRLINDHDDLAAALAGLLSADQRLHCVAEIAGPLPLRRRAGGFEGLAEIIVSQQVSKASAAAIWGRLTKAINPVDAHTFGAASDETLKEIGLSRPKQKTLRAVSRSILDDGFDLALLGDLPSDEAVGHLVALHGIGPWTAEVYLMFCCGHPDLFPARDVAIQAAVQHAFGLAERPGEKALYQIAAAWAPWRATAARLWWAYHSAIRGGSDSAPV